jgi:hypothetical protein
VIAPPGGFGDDEGGNFVLLASDAPLPLAAIQRHAARRGQPTAVLGGAELDRFLAGAEVLTDDHAPVDQLLTRRG